RAVLHVVVTAVAGRRDRPVGRRRGRVPAADVDVGERVAHLLDHGVVGLGPVPAHHQLVVTGPVRSGQRVDLLVVLLVRRLVELDLVQVVVGRVAGRQLVDLDVEAGQGVEVVVGVGRVGATGARRRRGRVR